MEEFMNSIMPYLISLAIGTVTLLISLTSVLKLKLRVKSLEDYFAEDKVSDYFVLCPNCGQKVILSKCKIYTQLKSQTKAEEEESQKEDK